jgi:hypothetical protein
MRLFVVVKDEGFPRGDGYNYRHIRAYESEKRAQNYAKKVNGHVVEFVPKDVGLRGDPINWTWEELENQLAVFNHVEVNHYDGGEHKPFSGDSGVSVLRVTDVSPQKRADGKVLLHISTDSNFFGKGRHRIMSDEYIERIIEDVANDIDFKSNTPVSDATELLKEAFKIGTPIPAEPTIGGRG